MLPDRTSNLLAAAQHALRRELVQQRGHGALNGVLLLDGRGRRPSRRPGQPRRTTRALIVTPTRELAAQIVQELNDLAVHTPITGAAIYGGVGMGPQEHAFRSGVDVLVATPGRLLDHLKEPYAKLDK